MRKKKTHPSRASNSTSASVCQAFAGSQTAVPRSLDSAARGADADLAEFRRLNAALRERVVSLEAKVAEEQRESALCRRPPLRPTEKHDVETLLLAF